MLNVSDSLTHLFLLLQSLLSLLLQMREEGGPGQQAPPQGRQQHAQQAPQQAQQQPAQQPVQQQQQQPQAASVAPQKNGELAATAC